MSFTIQTIINDSLKRDEKKEKTSWWPTDMGKCLTGVYLHRLGVDGKPFDDRTLRVFEVGKMFEQYVVDKLKEAAVKHEEQVRLKWPERDVTGYGDVLITAPETMLYELKSKHSRGFNYLPSRHNEQQLWLGLKCLEIEDGRLLYVSKDDLRVAEYQVRLSDGELEEEVMHQLDVLETAWWNKLPPMPPDSKSWLARYCSRHEDCVNQEEYLDEEINYASQ